MLWHGTTSFEMNDELERWLCRDFANINEASEVGSQLMFPGFNDSGSSFIYAFFRAQLNMKGYELRPLRYDVGAKLQVYEVVILQDE